MIDNFHHKKKWGQNFLKDRNIVRKIVAKAGVTASDKIWEIGPGAGILTEELLKITQDLTVFEIDPDIVEMTMEKFGDQITMHPGDVIKIDWKPLLTEPIKIVANIPYQITSPLLYKICRNSNMIPSVTLMVQKEFADRLKAVPNTKEYAGLTLKTQFFYNVKQLFKVPAHVFNPPPRVDSAVIQLTLREDIPDLENLELFNKLVDSAFAMRRKTLRNNLKVFIGSDNLDLLETANIIDLKRRGETLSEEEYLNLYSYLNDVLKFRV
ncbi:MAG: 16S rRNA (adenine(1518)-N(6)/adenine(1519)-N(6))-dimethyltransferase RsmA [Candidatus Cloacimonadales bacterium]